MMIRSAKFLDYNWIQWDVQGTQHEMGRKKVVYPKKLAVSARKNCKIDRDEPWDLGVFPKFPDKII